MFNIADNPCRICSHEKVCSMKEAYLNFVKKFKTNKIPGIESIPECIDIQVRCQYQDSDIRVRSW